MGESLVEMMGGRMNEGVNKSMGGVQGATISNIVFVFEIFISLHI